jgi:hypothetical protein
MPGISAFSWLCSFIVGDRPRSPILNAFVERWIQAIQVECLNHFVVLGTAHLNHLVEEFVTHYQEERPHQGLDNKLFVPGKPPSSDETIPGLAQIVCRQRLGGLLRHYERRVRRRQASVTECPSARRPWKTGGYEP